MTNSLCRNRILADSFILCVKYATVVVVGVVVALLFYVHGKHLRSYRDGQLT